MEAYEEIPVFIPCGEEILSAVHTRPAAHPRGLGFIYLLGRGTGGSFGRRRLTVRMCRRLAGERVDALRLDYHGVGESTGSVGMMSSTMPFRADLDAGIRWLRANGIERVVLAGTCFGGRTVLASAPHVEGLAGVILVALSFGDAVRPWVEQAVVLESMPWKKIRRGLHPSVWRGLFDPERRGRYFAYARSLGRAVLTTRRARHAVRGEDYWVSPSVLDALEDLARWRVPVLFVFGDDDWSYRQFQRARKGRLGRLLDAPGSVMELTVFEGRVHDSGQLEIHDQLIERVSEWVGRLSVSAGTLERSRG